MGLLLVGLIVGFFLRHWSVTDLILLKLYRSRQKLPQDLQLSDTHLNDHQTHWGNVGYWSGTQSFVEANEQLATLIAQGAQFSPEGSSL